MKICKVEKKREVVDVDYEVCGNEYCCELMKKWLRIDTYGRNNLKYNPNTGRFNICVRESESDYGSYSSKEGHAAYEDLDFCPFCGMRLQSSQPLVTVAYTKKKPKKKGLFGGKK
jgi:transcription elongation factor Elf1